MVYRLFSVVLITIMMMGTVSGTSTARKVQIVFAPETKYEAASEPLIATFNAQSGNTEVAMQSWSDWEALLTHIVGGVGPDVMSVYGDWSTQLADMGLLLDLEPHVSRTFTAEDWRDIPRSLLDMGVLFYGERRGLRYGLPSWINLSLLFANPNHFSEVGLERPEVAAAAGRWTMEDFRLAARRLTTTQDGTVQHYGLQANVWTIGIIGRWLSAFGGGFFAYPESPLRYTFDSPESISALTFLQEMIWEDASVGGGFERGTASMWDAWSSSIEPSLLNRNVDWDIIPRPMGPAGEGYVHSKNLYSVNALTKYPEAALEFLTYLTSRSCQRLWMAAHRSVPPRMSLVRQLSEHIGGNWSLRYFEEGLAKAAANPNTVLPYAYDLAVIIRDVLPPILQPTRERANAVIALAQIRPQVDAVLAQARQ